MIAEYKEVKEYHDNGQIRYECTYKNISDNLFKGAFYRYENEAGEAWIKTGIERKFFSNGQIAWQLKYNDDGSLSDERFPHYREDGSRIVY